MAQVPDSRAARDDTPVYAIGVVATMLTCHPQTLRMYERSGLVVPQRTGGNVRLYSERDIERIRHVQSYTAMGVNLAGVEIIFKLLDRIRRMEAVVAVVAEHATESADDQGLLRDLRAALRTAVQQATGQDGDSS